MEIQFISEITVKEIDKMQMGSDSMIAGAAWVSTNAEDALQRAINNPDDVPGVINYLVKHRHGSPFEHGAITLYVHAPIVMWREWHRHRIGFSYNEQSGRYMTLEPVFYIPSDDRPMFKVDNWKPGRPKFLTIDEEMKRVLASKTSAEWEEHGPMGELAPCTRYKNLTRYLQNSYEQCYKAYLRNLEMGVDPGLARDCLPVGIYSSCWVTCNPRSIMSFLSLRVESEESTFKSYPLYEIDNAARQLEEIFKKYWPITHAAFVKNGRVAP